MFAKKYIHYDKNVGKLRRVSGYWRVEQPSQTLGASIKLFGSDRFGPNKRALQNYIKYVGSFELIWSDAVGKINNILKKEYPHLYATNVDYVILEIIFGIPKGESCDCSIAFGISNIEDNEFYVNFYDGEFKSFGAMNCMHS